MRLATVEVKNPSTISESKDGRLILISDDNQFGCYAPSKWPTLMSAIESWNESYNELSKIQKQLNVGALKNESFPLNSITFKAPLPRTYCWLDGSAFIQHIILVRKARNADLPEDLLTIPLMYQGISDTLLGPNEPIKLLDESWGLDFEGEIAIITDEVPMGVSENEATSHIKLILLMNDISLRNLIPKELSTGFGFFHGKPSSSFAPFAITPDELGKYWMNNRVHLPLESWLNNKKFGSPNAGEMHFSFAQLIVHGARTRKLSPGTIIGSGTVSNKDESVGSSCLAEKRTIEKIHTGQIQTPFMKVGDCIKMQVNINGKNIFGSIEQEVVE